jgi:hypothetical protein
MSPFDSSTPICISGSLEFFVPSLLFKSYMSVLVRLDVQQIGVSIGFLNPVNIISCQRHPRKAHPRLESRHLSH